MTAAPASPGRGLPVYQPATAVLAGTCSAPAAVRPSRTSLVRTPMAGISRLTGTATGRARDACRGLARAHPARTSAARTSLARRRARRAEPGTGELAGTHTTGRAGRVAACG